MKSLKRRFDQRRSPFCMKKVSTSIHARVLLAAAAFFASLNVQGADKTWDGGGADSLWQTGLNWIDNTAPAAGDRLIFTGTTRTTTTNNFPVGTLFNGIS